MTTEIKLLESLCVNLDKVVADRNFRTDKQSQEFTDLMQALSDSKLFIQKAHTVDKASAKVAPRKRNVKSAI